VSTNVVTSADVLPTCVHPLVPSANRSTTYTVSPATSDQVTVTCDAEFAVAEIDAGATGNVTVPSLAEYADHPVTFCARTR
jgi:hypothetical protein